MAPLLMTQCPLLAWHRTIQYIISFWPSTLLFLLLFLASSDNIIFGLFGASVITKKLVS